MSERDVFSGGQASELAAILAQVRQWREADTVRSGNSLCGDADHGSGFPAGAAKRVPHLHCCPSTGGFSSDPLPMHAAADSIPCV
jgi:hypothetical protein